MRLTIFEAASDRVSYLGTMRLYFSSGGAESNPVQLASESLNIGKCCMEERREKIHDFFTHQVRALYFIWFFRSYHMKGWDLGVQMGQFSADVNTYSNIV